MRFFSFVETLTGGSDLALTVKGAQAYAIYPIAVSWARTRVAHLVAGLDFEDSFDDL